jgi:hypothetical protein
MYPTHLSKDIPVRVKTLAATDTLAMKLLTRQYGLPKYQLLQHKVEGFL